MINANSWVVIIKIQEHYIKSRERKGALLCKSGTVVKLVSLWRRLSYFRKLTCVAKWPVELVQQNANFTTHMHIPFQTTGNICILASVILNFT